MYAYSSYHYDQGFYVIHIITGVRKKLEAAAKAKDCRIIGHWQRSIINHMCCLLDIQW